MIKVHPHVINNVHMVPLGPHAKFLPGRSLPVNFCQVKQLPTVVDL